MIGDVVDLAVGGAGTVLYLWAWTRLQARVGAGTQPRQRRPLVQATFFLLLTPYLLVLFWVMERLGGRLDAWLAGPPG